MKKCQDGIAVIEKERSGTIFGKRAFGREFDSLDPDLEGNLMFCIVTIAEAHIEYT
ncbi:MAG: hypothetical protein WCL00_08115 [Bacteroidota bacterium]